MVRYRPRYQQDPEAAASPRALRVTNPQLHLATFLHIALSSACLVLALFAVTRLSAAGEPAGPGVGLTFETLTVGKATLHHAVAVSVNVRTVVFRHETGLTSVLLRDLPADLQQKFGYDPAHAAIAEESLAGVQAKLIHQQQNRHQTYMFAAKNPHASAYDRLFQEFGHRPNLHTLVDFRPQFANLELIVKNQGRRASCAVFAVVSALEFQYAQVHGSAEKFSEEYVTWATRRTLGRAAYGDSPEPLIGTLLDEEDRDTGFSILEVVNGLRAYGVPLQSELPNTYGSDMSLVRSPPPSLVEAAKLRSNVFLHIVPGRYPAVRIPNLINTLNAEVPVIVGLRWPSFRSIHAGFLDTQTPVPNHYHAVTLVGYRNSTGMIEDTVFLFKNSWGRSWGLQGYGEVTYRYLESNLLEAAILELAP